MKPLVCIVIGLAMAPLAASLTTAQTTALSMTGPVTTPECGAPVTSYFTFTNGKQVEANRLEFSATSTLWTQRTFLPNGALIFESEARLEVHGLPASLPTAGATTFQLIGTFAAKSTFQGNAGSLTYEIVAEGADLSGITDAVRLDASHPEDKRSVALTPRTSEVTLRLRLHNSPCMATWIWRSTATTEIAGRPAEASSSSPSLANAAGSDAGQANVNALIVEARKAYDRAAGQTGMERADALREALSRLKRIVDNHPTTDSAVTLIGGGQVAGISIPAIEKMLAGAAGLPARAVKPSFETPAEHALIIDAGNGRVLFEKNADVRMPPAGMGKLMTMAVVFDALKSGRVRVNDEFRVSENASRIGGGGLRRFDHVRYDWLGDQGCRPHERRDCPGRERRQHRPC